MMLRARKRIYNCVLGLVCALSLGASSIPDLIPVAVAKEEELPTTYINWNDTRQEIDGFGICEAFRQANKIQELSEEKQKLIMDSLFSLTDGAGISVVRNIIGDGGTWGYEDDGPTDTIELEEGKWIWTGDEAQIWVMNEAKKRGCTRFFSTAWSPPAWMKTNGSVINGGELREDKYQAYADYLAEYVKGYKEHHGIDMYAVSVANEPDFAPGYSSCLWSGEQFQKFLKENLGPTFKKENITAKVMLPETTGFGNSMGYINPTLEDPEALAVMDIVAMHGYGGSRILPIPSVKEKNKKLWVTEISPSAGGTNNMKNGIAWARNIHEYLTVADLNAYISFWGAAIKPGEDCCLIAIDKGRNYEKAQDPDIIIYKRLFTFGNFSRFVRPGYVRIGINGTPSENSYISAYKDPTTGKFAIVAINNSEESQKISFKLNGFNASAVTPYRTSETENLAELEDIVSYNGSIEAELAPMSVTTYVGDGEKTDDNTDIIYPAKSVTAAEYFSNTHGKIRLDMIDTDGHNLAYIADGDYIEYDSVDFGEGVKRFSVNAASASNGGNIELRIDSVDGELIGTVPVAETGSWKRFVTFSEELITEVKGIHKLYLKFTGIGENLLNMKWWSFNPNLTADEEERPIDPYIQNEAENYRSGSDDLRIEDCLLGGQQLGYIKNNSWVMYRDVEFDTGAESFEVCISSATAGGNIEIYLDSLDGKLVGTLPYSGGSNWDAWETLSCDISGAEGTHDLYLKFTSGDGDNYRYLFNVNWWKFNKAEVKGIAASISDKTTVNGKCTVSIRVTNNTDENISGKSVIAAVYDENNVLRDTKIFNFNANIGNTSKFDYSFDNVAGGILKVFVWDNFTTMRPLSEDCCCSLDN